MLSYVRSEIATFLSFGRSDFGLTCQQCAFGPQNFGTETFSRLASRDEGVTTPTKAHAKCQWRMVLTNHCIIRSFWAVRCPSVLAAW